jgi:hypothetical protein
VGTAPCAWAHVLEEGGLTVWSGDGGGANRSGSTAGEFCSGSPLGARFCDGGEVVRHGRG